MKAYISTKLIATLALTLFYAQAATAQQVVSGKTAKAMPTYVGEMSTYLGDGFGQHRAVTSDDLDYSANAVIGTTFLTEDWNEGTLFLTLNRKLEQQKFQFDIEYTQFLLHDGKGVANMADARIINGVNVLAFTFNDKIGRPRHFINSMNAGYNVNGTPLLGFVEVLAEGNKAVLLSKIETTLQRANYNVALAAGSKQDKIIKTTSYYFKQPEDKSLHSVAKSTKANLAFFAKHQDEVKQYAKKNGLKFKNERDLVKIVSYYNSL